MTYSLPSDVRLIIKTELSDSDVQKIIDWNDALIDKKLGAQSTSDEVIKKLSVLLTAIDVKTRDPDSFALGEYRIITTGVNRVWQREVREILHLYGTRFLRV